MKGLRVFCRTATLKDIENLHKNSCDGVFSIKVVNLIGKSAPSLVFSCFIYGVLLSRLSLEHLRVTSSHP